MAAQNCYSEGQQQQSPYAQDRGYGGPQQYPQPPPNYDPNKSTQNGQNGQFAPAMDGKRSFEQTFKVEKPKYNDLYVYPFGLLLLGFASSLAHADVKHRKLRLV